MIDTHAHYDDRMFDGDRGDLLGSFPGNGVRAVITVGCDLRSSLDSLSLAEAYPYVYAACGIHPEHAETGDPDALIPLLAHPKAVAVGEIGLDYHYDTPSREVQMRVFRRQLALAGELGKPVIIHDRDAHGDILSVLRGCGRGGSGLRAICFSIRNPVPHRNTSRKTRMNGNRRFISPARSNPHMCRSVRRSRSSSAPSPLPWCRPCA